MKAFREQFSTGYIDPNDKTLNVTPSQTSLIVSILSVGTFFGALLAAPMGDQIGRRKSLIIAVGIFCFGVLLQTIAMHIPLLVVGRYIVLQGDDSWVDADFVIDSSQGLELELSRFWSLCTSQRWRRNGFEEHWFAHINLPLLVGFF